MGRWVRYALVLLCLAAAGWALVSRGDGLQRAIEQLSALDIAGALVTGLLAVLLLFLSWHAAVADGGVPLSLRDGLRIYGVGQIGKYLPGAVWPVLTQARLGRKVGAAPLRMASGALLALAVSVASALVLGCLLLPLSGAAAARELWWAPVVAVPLIACLAPPVLNRLVGLAARVLRRGDPDQAFTARGIGLSAAWATAGNLVFGAHLLLLGHTLGMEGLQGYLLAVCAYSLASSVGVLVLFAPAGAGAREAVLAVVLAPVVTLDGAIAIALMSRAALVIVDAALAASQLRGVDAMTVPSAG